MEAAEDPRGHWRKVGKRVFAASVGGSLTALVVTPFDVVKTRLQAALQGESSLSLSLRIVRSEGASALFRGLGAALAMTVPTSALYFPLYDELKRRAEASEAFRAQAPLWAGVCARTTVASVLSPIEYVRTNIQSRSAGSRSLEDAMLPLARQIIKAGGWRNLWSGLPPTLMRDVPFSAIYWTSYEKLRDTHSSFVSGAAGGTLASFATHPLDVIKTRRQMSIHAKDHVTMLESARQLGFVGLFAGAIPRAIKVAPACAIMIASYELLTERD